MIGKGGRQSRTSKPQDEHDHAEQQQERLEYGDIVQQKWTTTALQLVSDSVLNATTRAHYRLGELHGVFCAADAHGGHLDASLRHFQLAVRGDRELAVRKLKLVGNASTHLRALQFVGKALARQARESTELTYLMQAAFSGTP